MVGPGAAVPVGSEKYAVGGIGVEACLYVATGHVGSIIAHNGGVEFYDLTPEALELGCYPVAAGFMCCRTWHARSEGALCLDVGHGRVNGEGRCRCECNGIGFGASFCLAGAGEKSEK